MHHFIFPSMYTPCQIIVEKILSWNLTGVGWGGVIMGQRVRQWGFRASPNLSSLALSSVAQSEVQFVGQVRGYKSSSSDPQAQVQAPQEPLPEKKEGNGSRSTLESTLPKLLAEQKNPWQE